MRLARGRVFTLEKINSRENYIMKSQIKNSGHAEN